MPAVSTMISEIYDAFLAGGTTEDKARKAAETLANYDDRFSRLDGAVVKVQSELVLLRWMVRFASRLTSRSWHGCFCIEHRQSIAAG